MYKPPFRVSAATVNLIAEISALTERFVIRMEQKDKLLLRKANRIKTIHSSLAIEGNGLTEQEVTDVINGKAVMAPLKEIQEVKNALKTYELYPTLDAFKAEDLLKAHGVMMRALTDEAGRFRCGGVGVFNGAEVIHMAPPVERVPYLIDDLFRWLCASDEHWLIRCCVFHYEFEFIHPFADGNGRMGRLWQSLILGKWNPVFEFLPVENMVHANQQAYYDAIAKSTVQGECSPFIEFMLGEILNSLKSHHEQHDGVGINVGIKLSETERKLIALIRADKYATAKDMAGRLSISPRQAERAIAALKNKGVLRRVGSNKSGTWEILAGS